VWRIPGCRRSRSARVADRLHPTLSITASKTLARAVAGADEDRHDHVLVLRTCLRAGSSPITIPIEPLSSIMLKKQRTSHVFFLAPFRRVLRATRPAAGENLPFAQKARSETRL
jgi:hypothetical protein